MELLQPADRPLQGDALIIVPPFAALERPALGPHLLQACAKAAGFEVRILYANLLLAAEIGELAGANEAAINAALSKAEQAQLFGLLDKIYAVCFADDAAGG